MACRQAAIQSRQHTTDRSCHSFFAETKWWCLLNKKQSLNVLMKPCSRALKMVRWISSQLNLRRMFEWSRLVMQSHKMIQSRAGARVDPPIQNRWSSRARTREAARSTTKHSVARGRDGTFTDGETVLRARARCTFKLKPQNLRGPMWGRKTSYPFISLL